jgi:inward rectifier potassium channel
MQSIKYDPKKNHLESNYKAGIKDNLQKDVYYYVIESSWMKVLLLFFSLYLVSNLFFASLYFLIPGSLSTGGEVTYADAFYFSVQTMATIGYGTLSPQGHLANILVTIEAAFGLIGVAVITGLVFAKISRPFAKIRFSKNAIINDFDGVPCLSFRMGNMRGNDIVEANVNVSALIDEKTSEGQIFRRIYDLKLKRSYTPFFKLSWSLFHPLDDTSPLKDFDLLQDRLEAIAITVTGHDGTFSTKVYSRHVYYPEDVVKGKYFKDIMNLEKQGNIGIYYQDFDKLI